jgi:hypothetical protein
MWRREGEEERRRGGEEERRRGGEEERRRGGEEEIDHVSSWRQKALVRMNTKMYCVHNT